MGLTVAIGLAARVALVAMFPFSGADKLWHWQASLAQCESSGLPGGVVMLVAAIAVEAVTPVLIVAGVWDRPAALVLAGFCVVTAFLYHPFWRFADLWVKADSSVWRDHFWQFVKNFGLVGGLLLVALAGSGPPHW